jgi:hypothetical protein
VPVCDYQHVHSKGFAYSFSFCISKLEEVGRWGLLVAMFHLDRLGHSGPVKEVPRDRLDPEEGERWDPELAVELTGHSGLVLVLLDLAQVALDLEV